jgi:hypothetical protein
VNNLGEKQESFGTVGKVREKCQWWERGENAWKAMGNCFSKTAVQPTLVLAWDSHKKNMVGVNQTPYYKF